MVRQAGRQVGTGRVPCVPLHNAEGTQAQLLWGHVSVIISSLGELARAKVLPVLLESSPGAMLWCRSPALRLHECGVAIRVAGGRGGGKGESRKLVLELKCWDYLNISLISPPRPWKLGVPSNHWSTNVQWPS